MARKKGNVCLYDTDNVARGVFLTMLRDFRNFHSYFRNKAEEYLMTDINKFRTYIDDFQSFGVDPYRFKAQAQIGALLKKWKFKHDVFTNEELKDLSYQQYFAEQERICMFLPRGVTTHMVLQEARRIAREALGSYDNEEHVLSCRFGTNSSIGCPLALAHIDYKLSCEGAFTSSAFAYEWFKQNNLLGQDQILAECVQSNTERPKPFVQTEFLVLKDVEKTWKVRRIITPLPLLDLYYSNGLGEVLTSRLKNVGIDISRQQHRHRRWVKDMSVSRRSATADLSSASDSITRQLLNAILPRKWYCVLKPLLRTQVKLEMKQGFKGFYTASVLPMGNGATFPLETLVFYCLIKAIGNLTGINGLYSVYGDDLIYPSRLHRYVSVLFPKLGFKLNMDKTFVSCDFRESCGSDFYRGCDVRPFYLKGEGQALTRTRYMAFLYKTVNGLLARWSYDELPLTFKWLFGELALSCGKSGIFRVPEGFPATAGIRTSSPFEVPMGLRNLAWFPVQSTFNSALDAARKGSSLIAGSVNHTFRVLEEVPRRRFTISTLPYYWQTLGQMTDIKYQFHDVDRVSCRCSEVDSIRPDKEPVLKWHRKKTVVEFRKGSKTASRTIVSWSSSVADKKDSYIKENTSSVTDWT